MNIGDMVTYDRSVWLYKDMHPDRKFGVVTELRNWGLDDMGEPLEASIVLVRWCTGQSTLEWPTCLMKVETYVK